MSAPHPMMTYWLWWIMLITTRSPQEWSDTPDPRRNKLFRWMTGASHCIPSVGYTRYIAENGNRDICVSDNGYDFQCVTVVNQAGRFRFRYRGNPILDKKSFLPKGIATDSQNQILVVCINNVSIYIIDKDGQFLRYISECDLCDPMGLCVDSKDNLLVTEYRSTKVKKIQYIKS